MSLDLCRLAKELASRFDDGPSLNPNELGHWWRIRRAIGRGEIECVSVEEVLRVDITVGGRAFRHGTKIHAVLAAIRRGGGTAGLAASLTAWGLRLPMQCPW